MLFLTSRYNFSDNHHLFNAYLGPPHLVILALRVHKPSSSDKVLQFNLIKMNNRIPNYKRQFSKIVKLMILALFIGLWEAPCATSTKAQEGESSIDTGSRKTRVTITNNLEGSNFTIHCKSKDDDMGTHVIAPQENYSWEFKVNFWHTTLFFCGVSWRDGSLVYDFYKASRDLNRCLYYCNWYVKRDGVYGLNEVGDPDIVLRWSSNSQN